MMNPEKLVELDAFLEHLAPLVKRLDELLMAKCEGGPVMDELLEGSVGKRKPVYTI